MNKLVTIIIPCYNSADCIGNAIQSAIDQTYPNCEIIVIDDGSRDKSLSVIKSFGNHIRWETGSNEGATCARNQGLALSKGEYIQFLDADDTIKRMKIQHQMNIVNQHDYTIDIVAGAAKRININKRVEMLIIDPDPWIGLIKSCLGNTSSCLLRREILNSVGGWDRNQKSSQEYELFFRMLRNGAVIVKDDVPLTIINRRIGSITDTDKKSNLLRYLELRREIWKYLVSQNILTNKMKDILLGNMFSVIRGIYKYDAKLSCELHDEIYSSAYIPREYSKLYRVLYSYLGFSRLQRIYKILHYFYYSDNR